LSALRGWLLVGLATALAVGCGSPSPVSQPTWTFGPRDSARNELKGLIEDVTSADGYAYEPLDDRGHGLAGAKVIEAGDGSGFVAVYGPWDDPTQQFRVHVGTSTDLLNWTWRAELGRNASQPTIEASSDGGYVVGWEQEPPNHLKFAYYATLVDLLAARPTKTFEPPTQLSPNCAEGTPSFYSASSTFLDVGFHYFRGCTVDRQARGTTDWTSWSSSPQPDLDAAIEAHGVKGGIGDRDGPLASVQLDMRTHAGSRAFTNPTIGQVTLDGRPTLVASMFIPQEAGAQGEIGGVIYYRFIDPAN
jgi:hypothetical protein